MREVIKLLMLSDEYLLGRIQEKAPIEEIEDILRYRLSKK